MIVDLQVNLETPDGPLVDPEQLLKSAKAAGLDGVVLTKEGALSPDMAAYRSAGASHGVAVFGGAKLATNHGLILAIFPETETALSDDFAQKADGVWDAASVIDAVEDRGGITVALRPYDRDVALPMGDHLFTLQGLSACEVQNGSLSEVANGLALEAASNMEMPCVGSSSAKGDQGLGRTATLLRVPVKSETELCEAIRSGDCWPVSISDRVPAPDASERGGDRGGERGDRGRGRGRGPGGGRGRGPGGDRGRGGDRDRGPAGGGGGAVGGGAVGGGAVGGEAAAGGRGESREGGRRRGRRGGRGRGGGGGGGGGGGFTGGDVGNRGGGGRGRGGPRPDDFGNRAGGANRQRTMAEDAGNRIRPEYERRVDENAGNRLRPGEESPYKRPVVPAFQPVVADPTDEDDDAGNR